MSDNQVCPHCGDEVSRKDLKCPKCSSRMRYKTFIEAYSWGGLGLFDMTPGIRDFPYPVRFAIMLVTVMAVVLLGIRVFR